MAYTAIDDPSAYFKVQLYTGNGSANHAITFDDTDTDMQPDLVWIKNRDATDSHAIFDSVRGATNLWAIDGTAAESDDDDTLDSFASDGFQVDADVKVNTNAEKYVSWNWKESATSGFDIVTFTGNETARTISHSLSAVPEFMIIKNRTWADGAHIYHIDFGGAGNTMEIATNNASGGGSSIWNSTAPTSSVFTVGTNGNINRTDYAIFVYLFAGKQGFSKFGKYEGNGNADGTFVYTGFRPAWVLTKSIDSTSSWEIFDNKREGYNKDNDALVVDDPVVEATADQIDLLSNGFKLRISTDPNIAETYIYMAFAEAPLVNSKGVPCNAR